MTDKQGQAGSTAAERLKLAETELCMHGDGKPQFKRGCCSTHYWHFYRGVKKGDYSWRTLVRRTMVLPPWYRRRRIEREVKAAIMRDRQEAESHEGSAQQ